MCQGVPMVLTTLLRSRQLAIRGSSCGDVPQTTPILPKPACPRHSAQPKATDRLTDKSPGTLPVQGPPLQLNRIGRGLVSLAVLHVLVACGLSGENHMRLCWESPCLFRAHALYCSLSCCTSGPNGKPIPVTTCSLKVCTCCLPLPSQFSPPPFLTCSSSFLNIIQLPFPTAMVYLPGFAQCAPYKLNRAYNLSSECSCART